MTHGDRLWTRHNTEWRDTAQVSSQWEAASPVEPSLLRHRARGRFWEAVDRAKATLLVTREYEHLAMALTVDRGTPQVTYMRIPHPSGLVYDAKRRVVHLASTRNPNQIVQLAPVKRMMRRGDVALDAWTTRPLVPVMSHFYPGSTYLHDLVLIDGVLHGNAVGENAVVRIDDTARLRRVWWPRCIESNGKPRFEQNFIQLNSIAAGTTIRTSFFSASSDEVTARRPGHRGFPVDGRGVVFSGQTREPVVRGLTRPHSARLRRGRLWVANSGYGELGVVVAGRFEPVLRVAGWTRGLTFVNRVAFVGVSRVLPRFHRYAPGLDADKSHCGVYAVDVVTGEALGSLIWPQGNQIFAIDWAPRSVTSGFPFSTRRGGNAKRVKQLFYAFRTG